MATTPTDTTSRGHDTDTERSRELEILARTLAAELTVVRDLLRSELNETTARGVIAQRVDVLLRAARRRHRELLADLDSEPHSASEAARRIGRGGAR